MTTSRPVATRRSGFIPTLPGDRSVIPMATATPRPSPKSRKAQFRVPGDQPRLSQCENGVQDGVSALVNQGNAMLHMSRPTNAKETSRVRRRESTRA